MLNISSAAPTIKSLVTTVLVGHHYPLLSHGTALIQKVIVLRTGRIHYTKNILISYLHLKVCTEEMQWLSFVGKLLCHCQALYYVKHSQLNLLTLVLKGQNQGPQIEHSTESKLTLGIHLAVQKVRIQQNRQ